MYEITQNQLWASNLLRISALLTAITYFVSPMEARFELTMVSVLISMVIAVVLAYFIRKGYQGPKWILLALLVISLPFSIIGIKELLKMGMAYAILTQFVNLMQVVALICLFFPGKKPAVIYRPEETE